MPRLNIPLELDFPGVIEEEAKGSAARFVQEWLCLNGYAVVVDGDFGPATHRAVAAFQQDANLGESGQVDEATFMALTEPMRRTLVPLANARGSIGEAVVAVAHQHLAEHPREIGGQNRGPWVRLYMDGHEGQDWPWCAGFVSFVIHQACALLGEDLPFPKTFSCDILAMQGQSQNLFVAGANVVPGNVAHTLPPGTVFLNRRVDDDWSHTGFVVEAGPDSFTTIEGNTNDEGSREGYEVCARIRGYNSKDFVRLG